jgi:AI-2 transport protein TqsA
MAKRILSDPVLKFFVVAVGLVAILYALRELAHIFIPFIIAYFLFFTFAPLNHFFTGHKVPLFLVIIFDIVVVIFLIWGVSVFIIDSFLQFSAQLPEYFNKLNNIVRDTAESLRIRDKDLLNFSIQRLITQIDYKILAGGLFESTFPIMGSILFVLFFFIFIVTGHDGIYKAIKRRYVIKKVEPEIRAIKRRLDEDKEHPIPPEEIEEEIHDKEAVLSSTFKAITEQIQRYIIAKVLINLVTGLVAAGVLALMGVDFPLIWGLFIFLFNFIPTIGSAIAVILPALMALLQYESVGFALAVTGVLAVIQTIFFNVFEPLIIGRQLNLNPLLILLSVLVWGYAWGIVGMLLAVPLTAVIKIIIANSRSQNLVFINDIMSKEPVQRETAELP